ncbi:hypothetical protein M0804_001363 [Polistes exclamans]|nr:hypothetical protein M0804_001363 [Polistes exclamans]
MLCFISLKKSSNAKDTVDDICTVYRSGGIVFRRPLPPVSGTARLVSRIAIAAVDVETAVGATDVYGIAILNPGARLPAFPGLRLESRMVIAYAVVHFDAATAVAATTAASVAPRM